MTTMQMNQHKNWLLSYVDKLMKVISEGAREKATALHKKAVHDHLDQCIGEAGQVTLNGILPYLKMRFENTVANKAIALTEKNFDTTLKAHAVVLIDFWREQCGACKALTPTINQLIDHYKRGVYFGKVNLDDSEAQALAVRYQVQSVPTILLFKNGEVVTRLTGNQPFDTIKEALDKLLAS